MSELSFEQMLEESLKTIRTGEVVTGKVILVTSLMASLPAVNTQTSPT